MKDLRAVCPCANCSGNIKSHEHYNVFVFEYRITAIAADRIAMGQLDCAEPVSVLHRPSRPGAYAKDFNNSEKIVHQVLFPGESATVNFKGSHILDGTIKHCLELVRHIQGMAGKETEHETVETLVASSYYGQAFFPAIFESLVLDGSNLSYLTGGKSQLRLDDIKYDRVRDEVGTYRGSPKIIPRPVDRLCNLFKPKDFKVPWKVELRNRYLIGQL